MIGDKFNEMYLKQNQAKNFEKKGNTEAALRAYLSVINDYRPNTDFPYVRACTIYMHKAKYEEAKALANIALKKLKEEEITGKAAFFADLLKKAEDRAKPQTLNPENKYKLSFSSGKFTYVIFFIAALFGVLISLPDKLWKLFFLVFALFSLFFVVEIIKDLQKQLSIKLKVILLILSISLSLFGAIQMPPSQWWDFTKVPSISDLQNSGELEDESEKKSEKDSKEEVPEINEKDLSDLRDWAKSEFELKKYNIKVKGNSIILTVEVAEGTSLKRGKEICESLLKNLNLLKGYDSPEKDKLGDLYKNYSVEVELLDASQARMAVGDMNKTTQKISWIH